MRVVLTIGLMMLAGCKPAAQREAEEAERQYEIVANTVMMSDKCAAAGRVADAWLKAGDKSKYERWVLRRYVDCLR